MDDRQIIALFNARSEQAIAELEKKYGGAIRKTAGNILADRQDVEECVNDTYLGVWNTIPPQEPDPLFSYVCRIARNQAVKRCHRETAQKRNRQYDLALDELAECIPSTVDVEMEHDARELADAVSRFLASLRYEDRFCFLRRYFYADAVSDIAAQLRWSSHRVSVRLSRVREKLHHTLKEEGLLE
ncbi:MAG: sigma-70 family RNA polymerase sigma factor [Oscillospiraceae bacterium]|nr:sigma-70 family RNA polymerase sigma factor [Oscillospiraceae bacterium]